MWLYPTWLPSLFSAMWLVYPIAKSGPCNAHPIGINIEGNDMQPASIMTHPNVEFHTQSSLLNRIWLSINHHWLALYPTEHLFREPDQPSWSFQDGLIFDSNDGTMWARPIQISITPCWLLVSKISNPRLHSFKASLLQGSLEGSFFLHVCTVFIRPPVAHHFNLLPWLVFQHTLNIQSDFIPPRLFLASTLE